jgi:hypothetical protein
LALTLHPRTLPLPFPTADAPAALTSAAFVSSGFKVSRRLLPRLPLVPTCSGGCISSPSCSREEREVCRLTVQARSASTADCAAKYSFRSFSALALAAIVCVLGNIPAPHSSHAVRKSGSSRALASPIICWTSASAT